MDPEEEYVILPLKVLQRLVKYSLAFCETRCPAGRDPGTCIYLSELSPALGLGNAPCYSDYGTYRREEFAKTVKAVESKYGMDHASLLKLRRSSVETEIDLMELEFALGVIKSMDEKEPIYLVRGEDLSIKNARRI
ncbi:hypothetical protein GCM10007981_07550 [Thermocladium modestius]|uniref:Uncharacterized protein n=1 Tax=Thermocladium modestius TaxID=62609 RepID=A0A830GVU7_9CREN|nr:hypothetical protein [Thermocladium modestius]GGP20247.1 hypothetical protein GCM10007981_07550 [Thermocladium modestius]